MRLIKLLAYALFGYALYEFVRGMLDDSTPSRPAAREAYHPVPGFQGRGAGAEGTLPITGGGSGQRVTTQEADGGSTPQTVGRGVIHR